MTEDLRQRIDAAWHNMELTTRRSDAPDVVAYRSNKGRLLHCLNHVPPPAARYADFHAVTSDDLEDGGICSHPECGVDVLIATGQGEEA